MALRALFTIVFLMFSCATIAQEQPLGDFTQAEFKGFIPVEKGRELYVELKRPARGYPTVVLLNGMTYSTEEWGSYIKALLDKDPGLGVVAYDMHGMGETFKRYLPALYDIPYEQQVEDLKTLLQKLRLNSATYLVGLSYGGGIAIDFTAKYGDQINGVVMMAPYIEPLEEQDSWVKSQIWLVRNTFPAKIWASAMSDQELYDYFLRQIVLTYPSAEPVILKEPNLVPWKLEILFRLATGIRKWTAESVVDQLPKNKVHLMVALSDQYVNPDVFKKFWSQIPDSAKASRILVSGTEHKIPEAVPEFAADWTWRILNQDKELYRGKSFKGSALTGEVEELPSKEGSN